VKYEDNCKQQLSVFEDVTKQIVSLVQLTRSSIAWNESVYIFNCCIWCSLEYYKKKYEAKSHLPSPEYSEPAI